MARAPLSLQHHRLLHERGLHSHASPNSGAGLRRCLDRNLTNKSSFRQRYQLMTFKIGRTRELRSPGKFAKKPSKQPLAASGSTPQTISDKEPIEGLRIRLRIARITAGVALLGLLGIGMSAIIKKYESEPKHFLDEVGESMYRSAKEKEEERRVYKAEAEKIVRAFFPLLKDTEDRLNNIQASHEAIEASEVAIAALHHVEVESSSSAGEGKV